MDWPRLIGEYGYAAIALGTLVEGEMVLIAGGAAAHAGWLDPALVFASGGLGVLVSDQAWFCAGRCCGRRLIERFPRVGARVTRVLAGIERHQAWLAIGFQFAPGVCTVTPIAFGMSRVPALRFLALDLVGIALWSAAMVAAGLGAADLVARARSHGDSAAAAAIAASIAAWWWWRRRRAARVDRGLPAPPMDGAAGA